MDQLKMKIKDIETAGMKSCPNCGHDTCIRYTPYYDKTIYAYMCKECEEVIYEEDKED